MRGFFKLLDRGKLCCLRFVSFKHLYFYFKELFRYLNKIIFRSI